MGNGPIDCNGSTQRKDGTMGPCGSVFCRTCGPDEDPFSPRAMGLDPRIHGE